ncbi:MAG: hypothetical protein JWN15_3478 [Firmicutes bacterium]|nr:hypothetical protein [Bacillota bacterium]
MTPEDEVVVRRIVREELTLMLNSFKKASEHNRYRAEDYMDSVAAAAVGEVASDALYELPHAADCESRSEKSFARCTCGLPDQ